MTTTNCFFQIGVKITKSVPISGLSKLHNNRAALKSGVFMNTIFIVLVFTIAWFAIGFSMPRAKRGIPNAVCAVLFGCSMITIAFNQLSS